MNTGVCVQGSGKTYTMGGGNIAAQTEDELGVIPRAIKHMYDHIQVCSVAHRCLSRFWVVKTNVPIHC